MIHISSVSRFKYTGDLLCGGSVLCICNHVSLLKSQLNLLYFNAHRSILGLKSYQHLLRAYYMVSCQETLHKTECELEAP